MMRRFLPIVALALTASVASAQGHILPHGETLPSTCLLGEVYVKTTAPIGLNVCNAVGVWEAIGGTLGGLPSGSIIVLTSGTCPSGFTEATDLSGKFVLGTLAANKDVGTTGGADAVTPAGTNSAPSFTGSSATSSSVSGGTPTGTVAWPAGVPTFAGAALGTHLHGVGTLAVASHTSVATKQGTASGNVVTTATHTVSGSDAAITAGTPAGTIAWPAGVPTFGGGALSGHTHDVTATGTVASPTFTGASQENRPAFMKVIFCRAT